MTVDDIFSRESAHALAAALTRRLVGTDHDRHLLDTTWDRSSPAVRMEMVARYATALAQHVARDESLARDRTTNHLEEPQVGSPCTCNSPKRTCDGNCLSSPSF